MADLICKTFVRSGGPAPYRSAVCLTQAEWDVISAADLRAKKDALFNAWLNDLANPPGEPEVPSDPVVDPEAEA